MNLQLQDSRLHDGNGVFLHVVHMLQQTKHAPTQSLAADLVIAMLSKHCNRLARGLVLPSIQGLAHSLGAFDCGQVLKVVVNSNNLKVLVFPVLLT